MNVNDIIATKKALVCSNILINISDIESRCLLHSVKSFYVFEFFFALERNFKLMIDLNFVLFINWNLSSRILDYFFDEFSLNKLIILKYINFV